MSSNTALQTQAPRVLTIAGSDSSGGAGIEADLKVFTSHGVYGMTAITALTAQNTQGVDGIHVVPADFLAKEIAATVEDVGVDVIKTGTGEQLSVWKSSLTWLDRDACQRGKYQSGGGGNPQV